jgi:hypothetical protein
MVVARLAMLVPLDGGGLDLVGLGKPRRGEDPPLLRAGDAGGCDEGIGVILRAEERDQAELDVLALDGVQTDKSFLADLAAAESSCSDMEDRNRFPSDRRRDRLASAACHTRAGTVVPFTDDVLDPVPDPCDETLSESEIPSPETGWESEPANTASCDDLLTMLGLS